MPELPEVETTRRGIEPHVRGAHIREVIVRRGDLRQPVPPTLPEVAGAGITAVHRRAKYLLLDLSDATTVLIHLGMSGSLRVIPAGDDWKKHDHVGITLDTGRQLRFHDPRRFGLMLHAPTATMASHPLLASLGPEPFDETFTPAHLKAACARRKAPVKTVIMDASVVVGVGNIYAAEALFLAGIRPLAPAHRITLPRLARLTAAIRDVLGAAIASGGTTLRDFLHSDGAPGYFRQKLMVYDRSGQPCRICQTPVRHATLAGRSTCWCPHCQR